MKGTAPRAPRITAGLMREFPTVRHAILHRQAAVPAGDADALEQAIEAVEPPDATTVTWTVPRLPPSLRGDDKATLRHFEAAGDTPDDPWVHCRVGHYLRLDAGPRRSRLPASESWTPTTRKRPTVERGRCAPGPAGRGGRKKACAVGNWATSRSPTSSSGRWLRLSQSSVRHRRLRSASRCAALRAGTGTSCASTSSSGAAGSPRRPRHGRAMGHQRTATPRGVAPAAGTDICIIRLVPERAGRKRS